MDEEEFEHGDCDQDCETCREDRRKEARRLEGEHRARLESAQQRALWGPGGLLWDPLDPLCQEVAAQMKEER